jgi:hypothetical protein
MAFPEGDEGVVIEWLVPRQMCIERRFSKADERARVKSEDGMMQDAALSHRQTFLAQPITPDP